jgi:hypothetical protein
LLKLSKRKERLPSMKKIPVKEHMEIVNVIILMGFFPDFEYSYINSFPHPLSVHGKHNN